jgi:hypothetical protein
MRPGSKATVQKLYGRIDTAIPAGTNLTVLIINRYNTYEYGGAKTGACKTGGPWKPVCVHCML